jgi:hypothetical protein
MKEAQGVTSSFSFLHAAPYHDYYSHRKAFLALTALKATPNDERAEATLAILRYIARTSDLPFNAVPFPLFFCIALALFYISL